MKRMFLYYTFPRRYIPFAWEQFSKSPRGIGMMGDAINSSGVLTTAGGQVELNFENLGADVAISGQRLNANIDAVMAIPAMIEHLVPIESLERPITPPGVLAAGGVASIVFGTQEALGRGGGVTQRHFLNDAIYSTWATRLAAGIWDDTVNAALGHKPLDREYYSYTDELVKFLMPKKDIEPGYERKILLGNAKRMLSTIQDELQEKTGPLTPWRRAILEEKARNVGEQLKAMIEISQQTLDIDL